MSKKLRRQQEVMVQQDKMAAMGQMAAGVAHEIANPLACMDSVLQLVQRNPSRMNGDTTNTLRGQIARINATVRQLTDFAHPADEKWQVVGIDAIVAGALQMVRFDHRLRDVQLDIHRGVVSDEGPIKARPHALEQVLVNIVLNALDALADTPEARMSIRVSQDTKSCYVEVSDNGHGIKPEHLDHLFEPFFTTKPVGQGTGLGLAISYRIIRDHGGTIEAENTDDGAKFTIGLPMTV